MYSACIQQGIMEGHFTQEQQRGVITLIPKKAADRRFVRNWRPITLLNTDYKIVTKAIAARLQSCIKAIVHTDQTGFIQARYIGSNLRTIQDVIDYTQMKDTPDSDAYVLSFDYEKAFDSVQWSTIKKAMELFGFGDYFRGLIAMILKGPATCVANAGYTSTYFQPTNGVRQGCCASPLLFITVVELMAISIRKSNNIKGITLGRTETRISQFADDTTCFVESAASAEKVVNIMNNFAHFSGLKLNMRKSKAISLSKKGTPPPKIAGLEITRKIHILGIWFSKDRNLDEHFGWNFQPKLQKMNNICTAWENRSLSLKGKITVFNSLVLSLIQYISANSITPGKVIQETKNMARSFVWSAKHSKVAYNTIIQPIKDGGLRLADIETRIKANLLSWIRRILTSTESSAAEMIRICTKERNLTCILAAKRQYPSDLHAKSPFYAEMLNTWKELHTFPPIGEEEIRREIIWYNSHIQTPRNPFTRSRWHKWMDSGIQTINDICMPNQGRIMGQQEIEEVHGFKTNFLDSLSIRNSIPFEWRRSLTGDFAGDTDPKYEISIQGERIDILNSSPRTWYSAMLKTKKQEIKRQGTWQQELELTQAEPLQIDWAQTYRIPYLTTRETKLHTFQYRIYHRLITCNRYLHKMKIRVNPLCNFCQQEDTIIHFLVECKYVRSFWATLGSWCENHINISFARLTTTDLLFGLPTHNIDTGSKRLQNWILLVARFYIHREKLFNQGRFSLIAFLAEIKRKMYTEWLACQLEGKARKFRKFHTLYEALGGHCKT